MNDVSELVMTLYCMRSMACEEAAKTIERLVRELDEAKADAQAQRDFVQEWIDGTETLRAAQQRAEAAEAECARLCSMLEKKQ